MNKKIITTDTDLSIRTSTAIIVSVGTIKFVKDEEYPWIDIFVTGGETDEFIAQEDTEKASRVIDLEDLKVFAINWVFENTEVVKDIKKETAPEVPVQEQSQNKMLDSIIENQVKTLQSVQEQCVAQGSFETVVLIAKTLIDIGTIHQQYQD